MAQQDHDRSEQATPHKVDEARKQGSIAKSTDLVGFAVLSVALLYWTLSGPAVARHLADLAQRLLVSSAGMPLDVASAGELLRQVLRAMAGELLPSVGLAALVAALATLAQVGPLVSFKPLKPDLQRVNPVQGFKRLFSMRLLIEAGKTMVKAVLLVAVLYGMLRAAAGRVFFAGAGLTPDYWRLAGRELVSLGWALLGAMLLVALADWVLMRWEYMRRLRMSRREVKDELRRREGDPRIKQRRRQIRLESAKRARGLGRVKQADVLVTNPTHLAVALKYDQAHGDTPVLLAKGAGELAAVMRREARLHGVPVCQNVKLARGLFRKGAIDGAVPFALFPEVARVLVWAYRLRAAEGGRP